ncbi:unnamed protein product [Lactuca virosa]|uniref:RRM domain-containing protein n=1 Tax=Lactuca virosa TaxID=75947 RepID=A0AAU9PNE5_9ASTR|nr:unnamed protein product [Lactuca virosa]
MKGRSGEWTEVRRRKLEKYNSTRPNPLTNIYVYGFPIDTRKDELWKSFTRFGKVVDVYMAGKKDFYRKYFDFVRFMEVKDETKLENQLQGIKLRDIVLTVNLEKHKRKTIQFHNLPCCRLRSMLPMTGELMLRLLPVPNHRLTYLKTSVILNTNTYMSKWLNKRALIGEAHGFDHIGNLPTSLLMNENTKYLGGLNMTLSFGYSVDADDFLNDESKWRDWF